MPVFVVVEFELGDELSVETFAYIFLTYNRTIFFRLLVGCCCCFSFFWSHFYYLSSSLRVATSFLLNVDASILVEVWQNGSDRVVFDGTRLADLLRLHIVNKVIIYYFNAFVKVYKLIVLVWSSLVSFEGLLSWIGLDGDHCLVFGLLYFYHYLCFFFLFILRLMNWT